jgi:hypothetical protein
MLTTDGHRSNVRSAKPSSRDLFDVATSFPGVRLLGPARTSSFVPFLGVLVGVPSTPVFTTFARLVVPRSELSDVSSSVPDLVALLRADGCRSGCCVDSDEDLRDRLGISSGNLRDATGVRLSSLCSATSDPRSLLVLE